MQLSRLRERVVCRSMRQRGLFANRLFPEQTLSKCAKLLRGAEEQINKPLHLYHKSKLAKDLIASAAACCSASFLLLAVPLARILS